MLLGALIQLMNEYKLYSPRPAEPFYSLGLKAITESMRNRQLPKYYSSENESSIGNHSGTWIISSYPFGLNRQGRNSPLGFGGFPKNKEGIPERLVQHNCSLKSLIDPLLQAAKSSAKGLNLAEYSHC